jgi:hypothetical protein
LRYDPAMRKRLVPLMAVGLLAVSMPAGSEDTPSSDVVWKIRREALERSQILATLHVLTDVYGPRLTASPNLKQAGEWAVQQMTSWGLSSTKLEPWDFGHPGWLNERFTAHLVSPVKDALVGEVLAWTPSPTASCGPQRSSSCRPTSRRPNRWPLISRASAKRSRDARCSSACLRRLPSSSIRRPSGWTRTRRMTGSIR